MLSCQRRDDVAGGSSSHHVQGQTDKHTEEHTEEHIEEQTEEQTEVLFDEEAPLPTQPSQGASQGFRRLKKGKGKAPAESSSRMDLEPRAHKPPLWMTSPEYPREQRGENVARARPPSRENATRAKAPPKRGRK